MTVQQTRKTSQFRRDFFSFYTSFLRPRERALLGLLLFVSVLLICIFSVMKITHNQSELEREITQRTNLLNQLEDTAPALMNTIDENRTPHDDIEPLSLVEIVTKNIVLAGMRENDLRISPQQQVIEGEKVRESLRIDFRGKPLSQLSTFWELMTNERIHYPVAITALNIQRNQGEGDFFNVQVIVSLYRSQRASVGETTHRSDRSKVNPQGTRGRS